MKRAIQLVAGAVLFCRGVLAAEITNATGVSFTFLDPPIVPAPDLPRDARRAGVTPEPAGTNGPPCNIQFGIVRDTKDHGALSNIVSGHIASIALTWADTNLFRTHSDTEGTLRRLLSAPSGSIYTGSYCQTYTHVFWDQVLGLPSIAARVEHTDGKPGQLLLFGTGDCFFAYQDRHGKWWLCHWREGVQKR